MLVLLIDTHIFETHHLSNPSIWRACPRNASTVRKQISLAVFVCSDTLPHTHLCISFDHYGHSMLSPSNSIHLPVLILRWPLHPCRYTASNSVMNLSSRLQMPPTRRDPCFIMLSKSSKVFFSHWQKVLSSLAFYFSHSCRSSTH